MLTVSFRCRICVRLDGASRVDCSLRAYISVCVFYKHRIERKVQTEGKMAVINCWVGLVVRWVLTAVKCCVDIWLCLECRHLGMHGMQWPVFSFRYDSDSKMCTVKWYVDIWVCSECRHSGIHGLQTVTWIPPHPHPHPQIFHLKWQSCTIKSCVYVQVCLECRHWGMHGIWTAIWIPPKEKNPIWDNDVCTVKV